MPTRPRPRPAWLRKRTVASRSDDPQTQRTAWRDMRLVAITAFVTVLATTVATGVVGATSGWFKEVRETVSSSDPIRPFVVLERDQAIQGESWVFPQAVSVSRQDQKVLTGAYDHIDEFRDWARSHGGVDPSITVLKMVIEGQSRHTVRVIGMRARVNKHEAPLNGMLLFAGTEQGN